LGYEKLKKERKGMKRDVPCFFFVVARTLLVFLRGRTKEHNKDMRLINRRHLISQTTITHLVAPSYAWFEEKAREYCR
jgi:hypothetical protein